MRSQYKIIDSEGIYFITSTIIEWIPIFTSKAYFDILIESIQFCQSEKNLNVYAYVIMDNHFHMICQAPLLSKTIQSLKRHTSTMIIQQLEEDKKIWIINLLRFYKKKHKKGSDHQLWQEGFHPQEIISDDMFGQKVEYIHYNPVKRGLVESPEHWIYSSARDFVTGEKGLIQFDPIPF